MSKLDISKLKTHFPHLEILDELGSDDCSTFFKVRQPELARIAVLRVQAAEHLSREIFEEEAQKLAQEIDRTSPALFESNADQTFRSVLLEYREDYNYSALREFLLQPAQTTQTKTKISRLRTALVLIAGAYLAVFLVVTITFKYYLPGRLAEASGDMAWMLDSYSESKQSKQTVTIDKNDKEELENPHYQSCDTRLCKHRLVSLFRHSQFEELEKLARELRGAKERYDNGEWMLPDFYNRIVGGNTDFTLGQKEEFLKINKEWIEKHPESITPRLVLIKAYGQMGFHTYWGRWTTLSVKERREKARWYYEKAFEEIKSADALLEKDPALYSMWVNTIMTHSRALRLGKKIDEIEIPYKKGIAIEPTYHELYYEYAWHLLTCWNGGHGDSEAFAMRALNETKDIENFDIYAMIALHFLRGSNTRRFRYFNFSWPHLKTGIKKLVNAYPKSEHNLIYFLWFACRWKDQELAKELFVKLEETDKKNWHDSAMDIWRTDKNFKAWRNWAFQNGPIPT